MIPTDDYVADFGLHQTILSDTRLHRPHSLADPFAWYLHIVVHHFLDDLPYCVFVAVPSLRTTPAPKINAMENSDNKLTEIVDNYPKLVGRNNGM